MSMPKRENGVRLRKESNHYQWGIRTPKDLLHLYDGKHWACRKSLETSDLREANRLAVKLRHEWTETFARQRGLKPLPLTREKIPFLADALRQEVLKADEQERLTSTYARLPLADRKQRIEASSDDFAYLIEANNDGNIDDALPALQAIASDHRILIDKANPYTDAALLKILEAQLDIARTRLDRDNLKSVPTPPKRYRLAEVFAHWEKTAAGLKTSKGAKANRFNAMKMFTTWADDPYVHKFTRDQAHLFSGYLVNLPGSSSVASRRLMYVNALFEHALHELDADEVKKNPFAGIKIASKTETPRDVLTNDQIKALFDQPIWTQYALPKKQSKAGADAAYWIPLIALYSAARPGEICQLHVADIHCEDGIWVIDHNTNTPDKSLKNDASKRQTPIHSELIRLGFLAYAEAAKAAGHVRLFPALKLRNGKNSHNFSEWYNSKPRMSAGIEIPDFYHFRHTAKTKMARKNESTTLSQELVMGHTPSSAIGAGYTHLQLPDLQKAIESIEYEGFSLPKTYAGEPPQIRVIKVSRQARLAARAL